MFLNRLNIKGMITGSGWSRPVTAFLFIIVSLVFIGTTPLKSQIISISSRFDTTAIWIGEQTNFTITVEQPDDMYVDFPRLSDTLSANIEILSAHPADTVFLGDNKLKITRSYRVTSFNQGEQYVEALPFVFLVDDDQRVLNTHRVRLEVLAPEIDREAGIYDIKDPLGIPLGFFEILPWILLLLVIAVLVWLIVRYLSKRKHGIPLSESLEPSEPAHVIAMRELKQLKSESLWQQGRIREYYTRMTEIVRIYIERQFGIMAMEQTSDEIIGELYGWNGVDREVVDSLRECLYLADLVKFAKARPVEQQHEASLNTAFHFVKASYGSKREALSESPGSDPGSDGKPEYKPEYKQEENQKQI